MPLLPFKRTCGVGKHISAGVGDLVPGESCGVHVASSGVPHLIGEMSTCSPSRRSRTPDELPCCYSLPRFNAKSAQVGKVMPITLLISNDDEIPVGRRSVCPSLEACVLDCSRNRGDNPRTHWNRVIRAVIHTTPGVRLPIPMRDLEFPGSHRNIAHARNPWFKNPDPPNDPSCCAKEDSNSIRSA